MRIALFTDGIYPYVVGGMQKHSFYMAKYFAINKVEVDLYHTAPDLSVIENPDCFSAEEKKYIRSFPIAFPKLDKLPGHYIRESYAYASAMYEKFNQRPAVDFIYVQGLCGWKLLEEKNKINIPVGVNFHGLEMFQQAPDLRSKLEQYLFKKPVLRSMQAADVVFSLGGKLSELMKKNGLPAKKILQIPIGIDAGWLRSVPFETNSIRNFVFIGRYERRKGIEELTAVLKELLPSRNFNFAFIGAIPENKKIQAPNIRYHGSITDVNKIRNILTAADVLVCPSYSEGMPTVILEAMASGLAIIASNVGAVAEQVSGSNGMLIAPGNRAELKQAITRFINMQQPELLQMKQHSVQQIRDSFLWEQIIAKILLEIQKIVAAR